IAGLTEPIEFTFIFTSPLLYFIHAVYTGLAGATLYVLGIRHGFPSGGSVIDYALNLGIAEKGLFILPIGLAFGVLYYFTCYTHITKMNIPVIGREKDEEVGADSDESGQELELSHSKYEYMAKKVLESVGGRGNVTDYDNCMSRLRLVVDDMEQVNEE